MRQGYRFTAIALLSVAAGCTDPAGTAGPEASPELTEATPVFATKVLTGGGHHTRTVAGVTALTSFNFVVKRLPDGSADGHYWYNFRANGFNVDGRVTCATRSGNQVWVSGVVDRVRTTNPAFESLLGLEMWWRSVDGGAGGVDSTTGLGFGFPGTAITAESWCRDQPVALVMRAVEQEGLVIY